MTGLVKTDVDGLKYQGRRGVIVNTDDADYVAYVQKRKALDEKTNEVQQLKEDINIVKGEIDEIKNLLQQLLARK